MKNFLGSPMEIKITNIKNHVTRNGRDVTRNGRDVTSLNKIGKGFGYGTSNGRNITLIIFYKNITSSLQVGQTMFNNWISITWSFITPVENDKS